MVETENNYIMQVLWEAHTDKKILYLSPEGSDWREAWTAASSYGVGCDIGWLCGGVNNGTLFSSLGGNSSPADWKPTEQASKRQIMHKISVQFNIALAKEALQFGYQTQKSSSINYLLKFVKEHLMVEQKWQQNQNMKTGTH